MVNDLENLRKDRLDWVNSTKKNNFDVGINRLLTELYPDNAHFIYELLQNAEDPKATEVCFNLTDSAVEFKHNGKRLFTLKDIESITSIGNSTKRDDETSIGKFGVGFKAVFAYTDTPEIHSGDYHFRIHDLVVPDLVVPEADGITKTAFVEPETRFIFPFNNPKKLPEIAAQEIETGLCNLGDNTLLFLSHIRKIDYKLPSGEIGSLQRIDHEDGRIEIRFLHPNGTETISHWLHFQKEFEVIDEDGKAKHCNIAIAYSLIEEANKKGEVSTWKIVPLEHGQVSIYFPAEKETSNLRFHLHAPFASTVARDSVRSCSSNDQLLNHMAELAVDSLLSIKKMGLLNRAFLEVLPNSNDNINKFYEPISTQIWEALRSQPLVPTYSGGFSAGELLYHAIDDKGNKLKNLLDGADIAHLEDRTDEILDWCLDVPAALLKKIGIQTLSSEQFKNKLLSPDFALSDWLELKENTWMQQLYSYLHRYSDQLKNKALVRLNEGSHVLATEAYFPSEDIVNDKEFLRVCAETYQSGNEQQQEECEQALKFLQEIGVNLKVTEREQIESDIKKWTTKKPSDDDYLTQLRIFIDYSKEGDISIFRDKHIFWGDQNNEKTAWYTAKQLFIDGSGISCWYEKEPDYYVLSKKYTDLPSNIDKDELVEFAKKLGAKDKEDVSSEDIQAILSRWKTKPSDKTNYLNCMSRFIVSKYHLLFKDQAIFWGDTNKGELRLDLLKADQLFIDQPFEATHISTWYADNDNYSLLSTKYVGHLDIPALITFAKKLGAKDRLPIIEIKATEQYTYNQNFKCSDIEKSPFPIDKDWCIADVESDKDGLEKWLENPSEAKSSAIWMTMCHPDTKVEFLSACHKKGINPHCKADTRASRLVYALKMAAWIPQINDLVDTHFVSPAQAIQDRLPENFKYVNHNDWLTLLEFGKEEKERIVENQRKANNVNLHYQEKVSTARDAGFDSPEDMEVAANLLKEAKRQGISGAELLEMATKIRPIELPQHSVTNSERRQKGVLEASENAPSNESAVRERAIKVGSHAVIDEAKAYLRYQYTNNNHELVCQCCEKEMPFKINNVYYFEAVQCIKNQEQHHNANRLALCPVCAAKYQHACETDGDEIRRLIIELKEPDDAPSVEVPVRLAGEQHYLRFVGTHWFDLKTLLK